MVQLNIEFPFYINPQELRDVCLCISSLRVLFSVCHRSWSIDRKHLPHMFTCISGSKCMWLVPKIFQLIFLLCYQLFYLGMFVSLRKMLVPSSSMIGSIPSSSLEALLFHFVL